MCDNAYELLIVHGVDWTRSRHGRDSYSQLIIPLHGCRNNLPGRCRYSGTCISCRYSASTVYSISKKSGDTNESSNFWHIPLILWNKHSVILNDSWSSPKTAQNLFVGETPKKIHSLQESIVTLLVRIWLERLSLTPIRPAMIAFLQESTIPTLSFSSGMEIISQKLDPCETQLLSVSHRGWLDQIWQDACQEFLPIESRNIAIQRKSVGFHRVDNIPSDHGQGLLIITTTRIACLVCGPGRHASYCRRLFFVLCDGEQVQRSTMSKCRSGLERTERQLKDVCCVSCIFVTNASTVHCTQSVQFFYCHSMGGTSVLVGESGWTYSSVLRRTALQHIWIHPMRQYASTTY